MRKQLLPTQILLEPEQYAALAELAAREGRSVTEVARAMIQRALEQRQQAALANPVEVTPAIDDKPSAADCVDEVVSRYLQEQIQRHGLTPELQAKMMEEIRHCRELLPQDHYDTVEVLNVMRAERAAQILGLTIDSD
jgi:hypothetical protein